MGYYRAFWPRFALIGEDVGDCGPTVESMVVLGARSHVGAAASAKAQKAGRAFAEKVDIDKDGLLSSEEIRAVNVAKGPEKRTLEELISFHDTDGDGQVSVDEVTESWV